MENSDVTWDQNVIDRWSVKKAVPAPRVTTVSKSEEITLSGYQNSTIILNEKAWGKQELVGKILLLAQPFSRHVQCVSSTELDDKEESELAGELVLLEVELWSDATGVRMTRLMNIKTISKLMSLLESQHAGRR